MESRRFIGNDLSRLYRRVRTELGPEALILSTRSVQREGARPLIELMAAAPAAGGLPLDVQEAALTTVLSRVAPSLTVGDLEDLVLRGVLGSEYDDAPQAAAEHDESVLDPEPAAEHGLAPPAAPVPPRPTVEDELVAAGLSAAAAGMIAEAHQHMDAEGALRAHLGRPLARYPEEHETALISIDGPRGAGRTTALLRMALDCSEAGRETVLVAADSSHAGTVERIASYADAMGIRSFDAFDDASLLKTMRKQPRGTCLFIDAAPGWTPPSTAPAAHFAYLALPSHWQQASIRAALPEGHFAGVVPTFADIVTDLAPVISLTIESGLGLAFISSGSDISTGITVAEPAVLASGIFTMCTGETTNGRLAARA